MFQFDKVIFFFFWLVYFCKIFLDIISDKKSVSINCVVRSPAHDTQEKKYVYRGRKLTICSHDILIPQETFRKHLGNVQEMSRKRSVNTNRVDGFTVQFDIESLVLKVVKLEYITEKMNAEVL